jgi:hypothetical protein
VHTWFTQAAWGCHVPVASHSSGVVAFAHWSLSPGVQVTHAPARQTSVDPVHAAAVACQVPVASHVSTALAVVDEHRVAPGEHAPKHDPFVHAWSKHALPGCQVPVVSHVSGVVASAHARAPGLHPPAHAPSTQAWLPHAAPTFCQASFTHTCGCCPSPHPTAPVEQTVVHAPSAHVSDAEHATVPWQLDSLPSSRHDTVPVAQIVPAGAPPSGDTLHTSG